MGTSGGDMNRSNYGSGGYDRDIGQDRFGGYGQNTYGQSGNSQANDGQPNYSQSRGFYGDDNDSSGTSNYRSSNYGSDQPRWSDPSMESQRYGGQTSHRGKGPKGYQRSDERIKEMISEKLSDHHEIDATEITVSVQDGTVTLEGTVDSRRTKNAVEDVAEECGCQDVQNNLRVTRAGEQQAGSSAKSSVGVESSGGKQKRN